MGIKVWPPLLVQVLGVPPLPELIGNKGWESGDYGGWAHGGTLLIVSTNEPRTGIYSLRGYTPLGTAQIGIVTWTITDPFILSKLAGKDVVFSAWTWSKLIFSASDADNERYIEVGDNIGSTKTDIPKLPEETWQQITATHTITAAPTYVQFTIRYKKGGARAVYEIFVDDMDAYII